MKKIKKLLIANRGEIAVRIIRTCREMGIRTVAVFSEVDRSSLFVAMADEAYLLGKAPSSESYLNIQKILEIAQKVKVDAIHPGYGFLSEKSEFSESCEKAGILFVGPSPKSIAAMGDKIRARALAEKAKISTIPGSREPVSDLKLIQKLASDMKYPILIKAAAGGGGKGMRVVRKNEELASAFQMAASEAKKAFSDERVYVEKVIEKPRHVEIQIARDLHGNSLFLFERECSTQRRHQKIIEEAPCIDLKEEVRQEMAEASLRLAKAVDYHGVGTVEYLLDEKQNFYFLEMNTRLQVEHTVTEMVTGLDLVRLQILIAQGEALPSQETIQRRGHAIQCRIYAEDPYQNFLPCPGTLTFYEPPEGPGIRHDTGVVAGSKIPVDYDPLIAKLVVHAETREFAIQKMLRALSEYKLGGVTSNLEFLRTLISSKEFSQRKIHTQFLDTHPEFEKKHDDFPFEIVFGVAAYEMMTNRVPSLAESPQTSVWHGNQSSWRLQGMMEGLK